MLSKEPKRRGTVIESLPNLEYRVHLDGTEEGTWVRCYVAGKLKVNRVHVLIGDVVDCVVPRGSAVGRIIFRYIR